MSYTVTCPTCSTTFEVEDAEFDLAYDNDEPLTCPGECGNDYEWDYDPDKPEGEEITLTRPVEYLEAVEIEDVEDDEDELPEDQEGEEEEEDEFQ